MMTKTKQRLRAEIAVLTHRIDLALDRTTTANRIINDLVEGLNDLRNAHTPLFPGMELDLDSQATQVPFVCGECDKPWPCETFNDLTRVYGQGLGNEIATRVWEPLVLRKREVSEPEPFAFAHEDPEPEPNAEGIYFRNNTFVGRDQ